MIITYLPPIPWSLVTSLTMATEPVPCHHVRRYTNLAQVVQLRGVVRLKFCWGKTLTTYWTPVQSWSWHPHSCIRKLSPNINLNHLFLIKSKFLPQIEGSTVKKLISCRRCPKKNILLYKGFSHFKWTLFLGHLAFNKQQIRLIYLSL